MLENFTQQYFQTHNQAQEYETVISILITTHIEFSTMHFKFHARKPIFKVFLVTVNNHKQYIGKMTSHIVH